MTKVIARIKGGIGNQLFCYAAARRLAIVNNAELVLDSISGFARDYAYRRTFMLDRFNIGARKATPIERMEPFERYRRGVAKAWARTRRFEERHYLEQEGSEFDARLLKYQVSGTLYLDGYWQDERYFKDTESTIRDDLRIKSPSDTANNEIAKQISDNLSVAVHVRFFDAPKATGVHNVSEHYYNKAIAKMEDIAPNAHYFLFSDHPEDARSLVNLPGWRTTIVSHNKGDDNAYADLWLMSQCTHFVIANSTFSWWGAWLGKHEQKHVIAPRLQTQSDSINKITSWSSNGLLPDDWIKI